MFHIRSEGDIVRNGFNFYRLSDNGSTGFIFKLGKYTFKFRHSKITGAWHIG